MDVPVFYVVCSPKTPGWELPENEEIGNQQK